MAEAIGLAVAGGIGDLPSSDGITWSAANEGPRPVIHGSSLGIPSRVSSSDGTDGVLRDGIVSLARPDATFFKRSGWTIGGQCIDNDLRTYER